LAFGGGAEEALQRKVVCVTVALRCKVSYEEVFQMLGGGSFQMQGAGSPNPDAAAQTLHEVEMVRDRTRSSLVAGWIPFLVFGVATLLSAVFARVDDGQALGTYWLIAGPLGVAITLLGFRRLEVRTGVFDRNEYFYATVIVLMVGGATLIGFTAENLASDVGPLFPVGAGLLVIGAFDRSMLVTGTGALIVVLGLGLAVIGPAYADMWAAIGEGAILIAAGLMTRPTRPSDRVGIAGGAVGRGS
jgi:hypothetical protein